MFWALALCLRKWSWTRRICLTIKNFFRLVTSVGQRKKFWVQIRNRISDLRIPRSEGLRFYSSWGLRIISLSHARDKTKTFFSISLSSSKLSISLILIKSFFLWWLYFLFLWLWCATQGWYCKEKLVIFLFQQFYCRWRWWETRQEGKQ